MKIIVATVSIVLFSTLLYSMEKQQNSAAPDFPEINVSAIQKFLDEGGNPNIQNDGRHTPLYYAMVFKNIECIELLLKNNANPNMLSGPAHETPLHRAVRTGIVWVQLLLKYNANPDMPDMDGNIPLHDIDFMAQDIDGERICKLLIEHTKNPFFKNKSGRSPYDWTHGKYKHLLTESSIQKIKQEKLIRIKEELKLQKLQIEHQRLQTFLTNYPITLSPANLVALQSIRRNTKKSTCTLL